MLSPAKPSPKCCRAMHRDLCVQTMWIWLGNSSEIRYLYSTKRAERKHKLCAPVINGPERQWENVADLSRITSLLPHMVLRSPEDGLSPLPDKGMPRANSLHSVFRLFSMCYIHSLVYQPASLLIYRPMNLFGGRDRLSVVFADYIFRCIQIVALLDSSAGVTLDGAFC